MRSRPGSPFLVRPHVTLPIGRKEPWDLNRGKTEKMILKAALFQTEYGLRSGFYGFALFDFAVKKHYIFNET